MPMAMAARMGAASSTPVMAVGMLDRWTEASDRMVPAMAVGMLDRWTETSDRMAAAIERMPGAAPTTAHSRPCPRIRPRPVPRR